MMFHALLRTGCLMVAILAAAAMPAASATGQTVEVFAGMEAAMQPDFLRRDLTHFKADLRLDQSQAGIVEQLYQDYEVAFHESVSAIRARLARIRPLTDEPDPADEAHRAEVKQRVAQLVEEAKAMRERLGHGASAEEFRRRFHEQASQLSSELRRLNGEPITAERMNELLAGAASDLPAWLERKAQLRQRFVADVQAILNEDQVEHWPPLERRVLRDRTLSQGRLSGESVDLFHIVQELRLPPEAREAVSQALEEYAVRIDRALRQRQAAVVNAQRELIEAMKQGDRARGAAMIDHHVRLRVAVRQVNDEFARLLMGLLPADMAGQFHQSYLTRGYGRIYRTTQTQRLFNAALELPGLGTETRMAIEALRNAYLADLEAANRRLLESVHQHEPDELRGRLMAGWAVDGGENGDDDEASAPGLQEDFARREDLGRRYARQLQGLLTPEQFQSLPGHAAVAQGG